ncbi:hypothetical protein [Kordiimonas lacus]|uniref:hypothetical protein n=1 Tax=Kordiimonas lacus TaxID=637679 RepID=UPI000832CBE1|nr:hypothetical protein [Kordiimonas lacus]
MKSFRQFIEDSEAEAFLDQVCIQDETLGVIILEEGRWVSGRLDGNIRLDPPHYPQGQAHAHVFGRKDTEIGVVNLDGSISHSGRKKTFRLHQADADALRQRGYSIPKSNIVEWIFVEDLKMILLG